MFTSPKVHRFGLGASILSLALAALLLSGGCPTNTTPGGDIINPPADNANDNGSDDGGRVDPDPSGDANDNGDDGDTGDDDDNNNDNQNPPPDPGDDDGDDDQDPDGPTFNLNIAIEGEGGVDKGSGAYEQGSTVTLTALPDAGWRFERWEGDVRTFDNPINVTMDEDHNYTAVFVPYIPVSHQTYHATYDWMVDTEELAAGIGVIDMSGNGQKVYVVSSDSDSGNRRMWVMTPGAAGRSLVDLPDPGGYISTMDADQDGSHVYLVNYWERKILKYSGGGITELDATNGTSAAYDLQTTATGDWVYFFDDHDLWRIDSNGNNLQKIVDDSTVPITGDGTGFKVHGIAVDGNGAVAFLMYVRASDGHNMINFSEVFYWNNGTVTQLTNDRNYEGKGAIAISGEGHTIVYSDYAAGKYIKMDQNGGNRRELADVGNNFGGMGLNYEGSMFYYNDNRANGGRRIWTATGETEDLMPPWNVANMTVAMHDHVCVTDQGLQVLFLLNYRTFPFHFAVYCGRYGSHMTFPGAPHIGVTRLSPGAMPRGLDDARLVFTAEIDDPDGADDIAATSISTYLDGIYEGRTDHLPAWFPQGLRDDGEGLDAVANDGDYTAVAYPAELIDTLNEVIVRIGVRDEDNTITCTDVRMPIGP